MFDKEEHKRRRVRRWERIHPEDLAHAGSRKPMPPGHQGLDAGQIDEVEHAQRRAAAPAPKGDAYAEAYREEGDADLDEAGEKDGL